MTESVTAIFGTQVLTWFDEFGRKHLPWQQAITPYRVWVSEIMLQQTQVMTVIPYFERFMHRFPTIADLANAPLDDVLHLWTGLGYYARARNLHRAAKQIVDEHHGSFPSSLDHIQALPGIGRSTAGAILSIAMDQRHPILDGNVKRVLTRAFGIQGFPGERSIEQRLWELADACTPRERVGHYTQAIMDLGATLCKRVRPQCERCPVTAVCVAQRESLQATLPTPRPKRTRTKRIAYAVIAMNGDSSVLLERRPPTGLWGGLWSFPQFDNEDDCQRFLAGHSQSRLLSAYHHSFTHFDLEIRPLVAANVSLPCVADDDRYCWYDAQQPPRIGLTKPAADLIKSLLGVTSLRT